MKNFKWMNFENIFFKLIPEIEDLLTILIYNRNKLKVMVLSLFKISINLFVIIDKLQNFDTL